MYLSSKKNIALHVVEYTAVTSVGRGYSKLGVGKVSPALDKM
jgi:hypothetical protein